MRTHYSHAFGYGTIRCVWCGDDVLQVVADLEQDIRERPGFLEESGVPLGLGLSRRWALLKMLPPCTLELQWPGGGLWAPTRPRGTYP